MSERLRDAEKRAIAELGVTIDRVLEEDQERSAARRQMYLRGGSALLFALLVVLFIFVEAGEDRVGAPEQALADVAAVAADQPTPSLDEFVHSEASLTVLAKAPGTEGGSGREYLHQNREAWVSRSRPGRLRIEEFYGENPNRGRTARTSVLTTEPSYQIAGQTLSDAQLAALTGDPDRVVKLIDKKVRRVPRRQRDALRWDYLTEPLKAQQPPLPSEIRAALIRGFRSVPGVEIRQDSVGQSGGDEEVFSATLDGVKMENRFTLSNAQLTYSSATTAVRGAGPYRGLSAGTLLQSYRQVSSRVVPELPDS
jgi:hypothetical protein